MKISIMQPYFLPYIGYWQLMNAVDFFVLYDDIKYTKKGWINRNKMLMNGDVNVFTLPLKKDSDYKMVCERELSDDYDKARDKILRQIKSSYAKAPFFNEVYPLLKVCLFFSNRCLFDFIYNSINLIKNYLNINTPVLISSQIGNFTELKGKDKVISICKSLNSDTYLNPVGGMSLYDKDEFKKNNIKLLFLKPSYIEYNQFDHEFKPWLSIIDVMMFNPIYQINKMLCEYEIL